MPKFRTSESSGGGDRQDLPEGKYRILHKWSVKRWKEDEEPTLQLELRKADDENCVMWLSGGKALGNKASDDGKTLVRDDGEDPTISPRCRAAAYLQRFIEKTTLSEDEVFDLSNLDQYECQIALMPNTSAMAKAGSKVPTLVDVNPLKAAATTTGESSSLDIPTNGEADDLTVGFTTVQLAGYHALLKMTADQGEIDLSALRVKDLKPYASGNDVEQVRAAKAALSPEVLKAVRAVR